ncbi:MAG TPA: hypothetical protein VF221_08765 [Chloroflexota bacterium]
MSRRTTLRLCVALLLPALALLSAVAPQFSHPGRVAAQTAGSNVSVCGPLSTTYVAATLGTAGSLAFSSPAASFVIAPGAVVSVATGLGTTAGSNVCVVGFTNASGQLVSATITANTPTTVILCGPVTAYSQSSATGLGSITIGGLVYPIAVGAGAFTGVAVALNANVCITATLNGIGQITGGVAATNTTTGTVAVNFCGTLQAYNSTTTPATIVFSAPTATTYTVASGTVVGNANLAVAGSLVCLVGQSLNGQLVSASFTLPVQSTLTICGPVTTYIVATSSTNGTITINGTTLSIAPGATFSGTALSIGSSFCIAATLNSVQQITSGAVTLQTVATATSTPVTTATATSTPAATATATATSAPTTPTATATIPTNIPPPPPPPGGTATATPTATPVPPTATATATAAAPTATSAPSKPTPTPKPSKKATATATTPPPAVSAPPPSKPVKPPKTLPSTGFGGSEPGAHNVSIGRVFRDAHGNVVALASLGIVTQPQPGGDSPISPIVPAVLGLATIGFGVLARKLGIARR